MAIGAGREGARERVEARWRPSVGRTSPSARRPGAGSGRTPGSGRRGAGLGRRGLRVAAMQDREGGRERETMGKGERADV